MARRKSEQLEIFLNKQQREFHAVMENIENTLTGNPAEEISPTGIFSKIMEATSEIEKIRLENNIQIVKNTLRQARLLLDRLDLLITYRDIFEPEESTDKKYTEIQIMNENNAVQTALDYVQERFMQTLRGRINDNAYNDLLSSWVEVAERRIEINEEDYIAEPSAAITDPVLQYAKDTRSYASTLLNDVRKTIRSIRKEADIIQTHAADLSLAGQTVLSVFADNVREDFASAINYGEQIVGEIQMLELFARKTEKFKQPHVAPFVRDLKAE